MKLTPANFDATESYNKSDVIRIREDFHKAFSLLVEIADFGKNFIIRDPDYLVPSTDGDIVPWSDERGLWDHLSNVHEIISNVYSAIEKNENPEHVSPEILDSIKAPDYLRRFY